MLTKFRKKRAVSVGCYEVSKCVDMVIQVGFVSLSEKCVNCFEKCVKTQRKLCESNEK